ncbi:hypothetical protein [Sporanaerobacter acetigenes]|uniref:Uncharacterized protein n=1 Tax=Sporanaerobacter acetigenes DSM 13106 TaxID=1123281 RepID=A0A1M5S0H1_9FIRM|nr:hypothetical protein [Sporanaerobacter acetigenes]SHH31533.1 hypothetical protein SAMN02745180_00024 [Sporanaerobacter acetigenes DSM 13106]
MYLDNKNIKVLNKRFEGKALTKQEKRRLTRTTRAIKKYDNIHEQNRKVNMDDIMA